MYSQFLVVVQLRHDGAHAVVAQAAGVVRRGDEAAAERVHLGQRADFAGVAEVVGEPAAREARAGGLPRAERRCDCRPRGKP